jgi:uncharacterized membrane protein
LQLHGPKAVLLQHRIVNDASTVPGTHDKLGYTAASLSPMDLWRLWALALRGETCTQVLHWGLIVLLVLSVVLLASPVLGRPWAWMAGVV